MRVWIVESGEDNEAGATRHGVFTEPEFAGGVFQAEVNHLAASLASRVTFTLETHTRVDVPETVADVVLAAENGLGDRVTLTGVHAVGSPEVAPTVAELGALKNLIAATTRGITGQDDAEMGMWAAGPDTAGSWTISRNYEIRK